MNENLTKEQREELIEDSYYNFVVLNEDLEPNTWEETGNPVIFGDIYEASGNFIDGSDTAIMSVNAYCKLKNRRVEDVMEYIN